MLLLVPTVALDFKGMGRLSGSQAMTLESLMTLEHFLYPCQLVYYRRHLSTHSVPCGPGNIAAWKDLSQGKRRHFE